MSSLLSYVWLSLKRGLGNYLRAEVLRRMGSPEAVYAADSTMLAQSCPSLRRQHIELLCDKSTDEAEQVITQCAREDIRILPVSDAAYPDRLRQIEDPPVVLYIRGRWPDFDTMPGIAVVGTRQATSYGVQVAGTIGAELAKAGFVTVSGMALGNDAAAHRGALRAGGLTVAVLAGGPDVCYPPQNRALMGDILLSGAVISEYPPGTEPHGRNYHQRNRIISGLSVASVIVEASDWRSGALITARHALDQGRDVYAVPGPIDAPQSQSCNELIAKGEAALLTSPTVLVREYSGMNWVPFLLGLVLVGMEAGSIYAYRAGWSVSTLQVTSAAGIAALLVFVGYLAYHEAITPSKLIGLACCVVGLYFLNK